MSVKLNNTPDNQDQCGTPARRERSTMVERSGERLRVVLMMTEDNPVGRQYLEVCLRPETSLGINLVALVVESSRFAQKCVQYNTDRMGGFYTPPSSADLLHGKPIPVYFTKRHKSSYVEQLVSDLSLDLVVAGGVGGIIGKEMLEIPRLGFLGCHPGLLPRMRGSNPIAYAILDDYPQGATCFWMDEGIDTGAIVYSEPMPVYRDYSYEKLEAQMLQHCGSVLQQGLLRLARGDRQFNPQKPADGVEYKEADAEVLGKVRNKLKEGTYACYAQ